MRLFVALVIPSAVRENLEAMMNDLRPIAPKAKWVRPENFHVTLKFIGAIPGDKFIEIASALQEVAGTYLSKPSNPVELNFKGLGFFPNKRRPRVFWAGIEATSNLKDLAAHIDHAVGSLGVPLETRPFTPHLTLARFEPPAIRPELHAAVESIKTREFGMLRTGEFHLIESKLKSSGAEYTTLQSFAFAAEA